MSNLIQVAPEISPEVGGVAAYAELLKNVLADRGYESLFLAPRKAGRGPREDVIEFEPSSIAFQQALQTTRDAARPAGILLHYVGYGYDPRGCPGWLIAGLERTTPALHITTIFHELHLSGPPWTTRFWLLPRQKNLIRRLSRMAVSCLVTSPGAQQDLSLLDSRLGRCRVVPTPSTFGEPSREYWPADRNAHAIVLGLAPVRGRVYQAGKKALESFCRRAGIELVHDVGPPIPQTPSSVGGVPVQVHGIVPAEAVSALLLRCRVLITSYPAKNAAKSTVIAAGMAHGCAIYNCMESEPTDGWSTWRSRGWDGDGWRAAGEAGYATYHRCRSWDIAAGEILACLPSRATP